MLIQNKQVTTLASIHIALLISFCCYHSTCASEELFFAITSEDINDVQAALDRGENPNAFYASNDAQRGDTPLMMAISNGSEEIARLLLNQPSININAKNPYNGKTALMDAIITGQEQLGITLIEAGANIYEADQLGRRAIDYANNYNRRTINGLIIQKMVNDGHAAGG